MKSNTSKYRYDRVTMGILMTDFAFSKGSAAPGDLFPIFNIASQVCFEVLLLTVGHSPRFLCFSES